MLFGMFYGTERAKSRTFAAQNKKDTVLFG